MWQDHLLRTWLRGLTKRYTPEQVKIILVDYRKTLIAWNRSEHIQTYAVTSDQVKGAVSALKTELEARLRASLNQSEQEQQPAWSGPHYYIVVDDYEGVATPAPQTGNPLNPLESLLRFRT